MASILFVCTANICRSPIAMGLMRHKVAESDSAAPWDIASAGTWAKPGRRAHEHSRAVMAEHGIDIEDHRSQPVSADLLASFDLILTMEQGHKEALCIEFPASAKRIFTISEMAGYSYDIPDPIGHAYPEYLVTYRELDRLLDTGMPRITKLIAERNQA